MTNKERYEKAKPAYDALMKCYPFSLEDLPDEEWKPIPDYPAYHGSNFGRIKSFKGSKQRILKPSITRYGYLQVFLSKKAKTNLLKFSGSWLNSLSQIPKINSK